MAKAKTVYDVTPEQFVQVWQSSESVAEAANRLGMPVPVAAARASNYRKRGLNLKAMRKKRNDTLDIEGLNQLIAGLAGGQEVTQPPEPSQPTSVTPRSVKEVVKRVIEKVAGSQVASTEE